MSAPARRFRTTLVLVGLGLVLHGPQLHGAPEGPLRWSLLEEFALANDRGAVLDQLIPGSEDYYYFHCLHAQQTGDFDRVRELLPEWEKRHGASEHYEMIELRQKLLDHARRPEETLEFLRDFTGAEFDHRRESPEAAPDLPTRVTTAELSAEAFANELLERDGGKLTAFTEDALWLIADRPLTHQQNHDLLDRLTLPDYPHLVERIVGELRWDGSSGFGSLPIHSQLTLEQLEGCLALMPILLQSVRFVSCYLDQLKPTVPIDFDRDVEEATRYLDRLVQFSRRLRPVFNAFKAHVLYHRLSLGRRAGEYPRDLFSEYLSLPRPVTYAPREFLERRDVRDFPARLPVEDALSAGLAPVNDDWELVRAYLLHFFVEDESFDQYADRIDRDHLAPLFAEAKLLAGVGSAERWYSLLGSPERVEALEERIDLDFAPESRRHFEVHDRVRVALDIKNVPRLRISIYAINALNFYREMGEEFDSTLSLDGLAPLHERVIEVDAPAWHRVRREFEFPELDAPGSYVIDFFGSGRASRAVIHKGRHHALQTVTGLGHRFELFGPDFSPLAGGKVWLGGHEFIADGEGRVVVPFTTSPGESSIVITGADDRPTFATLERFQHESERYEFRADVHVERESLIAGQTATLLIRPQLLVSGARASVSRLTGSRLTILATDHEKTETRLDVPDFSLFDDRESTHEFRVPTGLAKLRVTLTARVENVSQGKEETLTFEWVREFNGVTPSRQVTAAFLVRARDGNALEVRGRNGEPIPNHVVTIEVERREFPAAQKGTRKFRVRTSAQGRIELGSLDGVKTLSAQLESDEVQKWGFAESGALLPRQLDVPEGEPIVLPHAPEAGARPAPDYTLYDVSIAPAVWTRIDGWDPSLWRSRDGVQVRRSQRAKKLSIDGAFVRIDGLEAGLYELRHRPSGQRVMIQVRAAEERGGRFFSEHAYGPLSANLPLQIIGISVENDALVVRLGNPSDSSRVHVTASRYQTGPSPFQGEWLTPPRTDVRPVRPLESDYLSGRELSDEHRYILDRQLARRFPGVPVERPGLLLNPWELRETATRSFDGEEGSGFIHREGPIFFGHEVGDRGPEWRDTGDAWVNLDFLPRGARLFPNLTPDAEGHIRIPAEALGAASLIRVVAVDETQQVSRELLLPRQPLEPRDLTLKTSLDVESHFAQSDRITVVGPGDSLRIEDARSSRLQVFADLDSVYRYFLLLNDDPTFQEFEFLMRWPSLSDPEKRALYSKYACHELHVFLFEKDSEFFAQVVRPFLMNKKDPTFLDRYFAGDDLSQFLDPWRYEQLNVFEQILLGSTLPGEASATARHVRDEVEADPVPRKVERAWFDSAITATALRQDPFSGGIISFGGDDEDGFDNEGGAPARKPAAPGFAAPKLALDEEVMGAEESAKADDLLERKLLRQRASSLESQDAERRPRSFYRPSRSTSEYAENNYYHRPLDQESRKFVMPAPFWADYAQHRSETPDQPFVSTSIASASRNFTEMVLALAVLDLPFSAEPPALERKDGHVIIESSSPLLAFHRKIQASEVRAEPGLLVGQDYFRSTDLYENEQDLGSEDRVTDEFIRGVVYGKLISLTNTGHQPIDVDLLLQIPQGAVPVGQSRATRNLMVRIDRYESTRQVALFYFPRSGRFTDYPAHVTRDGKTLAHAEPRTIVVVDRPTQVDTTTWEYVSQDGTPQQVLDFLDEKNLRLLDLEKIAWRLVDPRSYQTFAEPLFELLSRRKVYSDPLWAYSLLHHDRPRIREYLRHQEELYARAGSGLDSPLVTTDPIERKWYQHLEYRPLVNARAHPFGGQLRIANLDVARHYTEFCRLLSLQPKLDDEDRLAATYYLLLQDRHVEALDLFASVDRERVPSKIQFDYTVAYLDLLSDRPQLAGRIAAEYRDYPVPHWRDRFRAIADYLDPSRPARDGDPRSTADLAEREPTFDLRVGGPRVALDYRNLDRAQVNYYPMDVELLFSTQPFVRSNANSPELEQWAMILPTHSESLDLPAGQSPIEFELPQQFRSSNVIVEVVAAGKRQSHAHYANTLSVTVSRNYGQLQVVDTRDRRPLPKAYVKVYSRSPGGDVRFYKDGYTDLQGRFDYVSLSTGEIVTDFALLVLHDDCGAAILETPAPQR